MYRPTPPFLAALAALLSIATFAAVADDKLTWKNPTQYTDGTALAVADIDGTVIRWAESPDAAVLLGYSKATGAAVSFTVPRDPAVPGTVCYQIATLAKSGGQSNFAPAAWVCKTIAPPVNKKPKVPTQLKVE